jgi:hypothetical protein
MNRFNFNSLGILLFFNLAIPAHATPLGDAAAAMIPGEWRTFNTNNIEAVSHAFDPGADVPGIGFDDNQFWNSKKRELMIETAEHGRFQDCELFPNPTGICWKPMMTYSDDTNSWTTGGAVPPRVSGWHAFDHVAWDDDNEVLYIREYYHARVFRYCVNNTPSWCFGRQGIWSQLPDAPYSQCCGGLTYHSALSGGTLLFYDGQYDNNNCGGLLAFQETTGLWVQLGGANCQFPTGDHSNLAEYSIKKRVAVFGAGDGNVTDINKSRNLWKIDEFGTIAKLPIAPCPIALGGYNRSFVTDPATGNFIMIGCSIRGEMWELNPDGNGTWRLLDANLSDNGGICALNRLEPNNCSNDFYGVSNPTYGVIMYWKFLDRDNGEVWLYKHADSVISPPQVDSAAPTVALTSPANNSFVALKK